MLLPGSWKGHQCTLRHTDLSCRVREGELSAHFSGNIPHVLNLNKANWCISYGPSILKVGSKGAHQAGGGEGVDVEVCKPGHEGVDRALPDLVRGPQLLDLAPAASMCGSGPELHICSR